MLRKDEFFAGQVAPASADFAYGAPLNESTEGALDGTPWCAESQVDEWAFYEALLLKGGVTPDGIADTRNRSQLLDALHAVTRGLIAKGFQAQEGATAEDVYIRLPLNTPTNPDWILQRITSTSAPTQLRVRQNTNDTTSKLIIQVPHLIPRFAINGVVVTVKDTFAGAAQKMRLSIGRYSRELTNAGFFFNATLGDGLGRVYEFPILPGETEPSSHVMFRSYLYNVEISPQSEPDGSGVYPSIYSIELRGKINPIPAGV